MNERCDKCKSNSMNTQPILGYMICTPCAEELRRMVSNWVNSANPAPKEAPVPKRKSPR
jgi:hypothetical protein